MILLELAHEFSLNAPRSGFTGHVIGRWSQAGGDFRDAVFVVVGSLPAFLASPLIDPDGDGAGDP